MQLMKQNYLLKIQPLKGMDKEATIQPTLRKLK